VERRDPRIRLTPLPQWPQRQEPFQGIIASRESTQVTSSHDSSLSASLTFLAEFVVFVPPRTQGVIVDPNYSVAHPTSAARLAQPAWGPPPWADGAHPVPPYPIPGPPPPGYYAPYYHPGMPPPLPIANTQLHPNAPGNLYAPTSSSPDGTCAPSDGELESPVSPKRSQEREPCHPEQSRSRGPPESVIDPSLETSDTHSNSKSPVSFAITSAAVQAVLDETRRIAQQQVDGAPESREPSPHTYVVSESAPAEVTKPADSSVSPGPPTDRNPPSTMFTEDGETMLHPGE
jgi:hypothetical protein